MSSEPPFTPGRALAELAGAVLLALLAIGLAILSMGGLPW